MRIMRYTPALDGRIRNLNSLPAGRGCKYLLCTKGQGAELLAKSWHRKLPNGGDKSVAVVFGK